MALCDFNVEEMKKRKMSFVINHFEDSTKWSEILAGTGSVSDRVIDSFKANCPATNDVAGLISFPQDLTIADLTFYTQRMCAFTGILLRKDVTAENLYATEGVPHYGFGRDARVAGGVVMIWYDGGFLHWFNDPVPIDQPALMRVVISNGEIIFYYEGTEVYREIVKGSFGGVTDVYIYLVALATIDATTVTGTNQFIAFPLPLSASISPESTSIRVGETVTFSSLARGGSPPYSYQWYLNNVPVETLETWTFTPTEAGVYEVFLRVTDAEGVIIDSNIATVTVVKVTTLTVLANPVEEVSIPIPFRLERM